MVADRLAVRATLAVLVGSVVAGRLAAQDSVVEPSRIRPSGSQSVTVPAPAVGWAIVRYSVLADGRSDRIRVFDIVPRVADENPVVSAVEQWVFVPGTIDDEPVDWHARESVVAFGDAAANKRLSDAFIGRYESIGALLADESYEEALTASESLINESVSRSEVALALAQQSLGYIGQSDWHSALRPLQLATDPRLPSLPETELLSALQLRFQVEVELGRRREALDTYRRIDYALDPDSEFANPYEEVAAVLADEWETFEPLPVIARVDDKPWRFSAERRTFAIADIEGQIQSIGVECDQRVTSLEYQPNAEWTLPESWGSCDLFVDGSPGTTFVYYEFLSRQDPQD